MNYGNRTLAKPWILPVVIISGLASAYAIPWNYNDVPAFAVLTTLLPLIAQFALACVTSVTAFLGKSVWLVFLGVTTGLAFLNATLFGLNLWGVAMPTLPKILLALTSIGLIPCLIWGRKQVQYSPPGSANFETTNGSDW